MAGQQGSESLEDQLCRRGSSAERDGMNCIALSRSRDQTLHHHQLAERVLETGPLGSPQRPNMVASSNALRSPQLTRFLFLYPAAPLRKRIGGLRGPRQGNYGSTVRHRSRESESTLTR